MEQSSLSNSSFPITATLWTFQNAVLLCIELLNNSHPSIIPSFVSSQLRGLYPLHPSGEWIHIQRRQLSKLILPPEKCPVSILYKYIAVRYRPARVADGPITARYRIIKNASWIGYAKMKEFFLIGSKFLSRGGEILFPTCPTIPISLRTIKTKLLVLKLKKKIIYSIHKQHKKTTKKRGTIISISFEPSTLHIHTWFYYNVSLIEPHYY